MYVDVVTCVLIVFQYIPANTALFQVRLQPIRDCEAWTVSYHALTLLCMVSHTLSS